MSSFVRRIYFSGKGDDGIEAYYTAQWTPQVWAATLWIYIYATHNDRLIVQLSSTNSDLRWAVLSLSLFFFRLKTSRKIAGTGGWRKKGCCSGTHSPSSIYTYTYIIHLGMRERAKVSRLLLLFLDVVPFCFQLDLVLLGGWRCRLSISRV